MALTKDITLHDVMQEGGRNCFVKLGFSNNASLAKNKIKIRKRTFTSLQYILDFQTFVAGNHEAGVPVSVGNFYV